MYPPLYGINKTPNYILSRAKQEQDYRFGPLLPFLAGVLVTTPFIFLSKNNHPYYNNYPPQATPYPIYQAPYPYPYQYNTYPPIYR